MKNVTVLTTCDRTLEETGEEVTKGVVTRRIALDASGFREVDLSPKFSAELDKVLEPFLRVSRPGSQPVARLRIGGKNSDRNTVIRDWAGKTPWAELLPARGRIPAEILNAFYAEHPHLERPPAHRVRLQAVPDPVPDEPAARRPASRRQPVPLVPPVAKFKEAAPSSPPAHVAGGHADRTETARQIGRWARSSDSPEFTAKQLSTFFPPAAITDELRPWIEKHPRRAKKWGFYLEDGKIRVAAAIAAAAAG